MKNQRIRTVPASRRFWLVFAAFLIVAGTVFAVINQPAAGESFTSFSNDDLWQDVAETSIAGAAERQIVPQNYRVLRLNQDLMKDLLSKAPPEAEKEMSVRETVITLPMPDGTFSRFRVFDSPIMEKELADRFPEIKTYTGQGIDEPAAVVRFDYTPAGFHALVLRPEGSVYIDPFAKGDTDNYLSYFKRDFDNPDKKFECLVMEDGASALDFEKNLSSLDIPNIVANGGTLRTYRAAIAATGEYTAFHGGTVAGGLAGITTTLNRVNAVYERDLSVRMILIANNNLIVYTNPATDPYANTSGDLTANQNNINSVIGTANYDIGHLVGTGGGGVATLNSPCGANKARGLTGSPSPIGDPFDIDYVAHEMGHQFGGNHTFNGGSGSCAGGNRSAANAFEPGSGTTIQAYAGICSGQDLQRNSDDYFHVRSLEEMVAFTNGTACDLETASGNTTPAATPAAACTIPVNTPFSLTGSASDANGDSLTYTWEEYDLGPQTTGIPNTDGDAGGAKPIFRSYEPSSSPTRVFPSLPFVLNNANVPPSTFAGTNAVGTVCTFGNCLTGELLPTISRTMNFQMTVRDNRAGGGGVRSVQTAVTVSSTAGPFLVTQPNTNVSWAGGSAQTVTWNVANTTAAPVSCANVDILMSTDGGQTFPTTLATATANDGTQSVNIPAGATTTARIKVQCSTSCFFDIADTNFTVTGGGGPTPTPTPVPPTPTPTPIPPTPTPTPVPPTPTPTPVPPTPTPTPVPPTPTPTPLPGVCTPTLTLTEERAGALGQFTSITSGPNSVTVDPSNTGLGLLGYSVVSATNALFTIPPFTVGTVNPVTATYTIPNGAQPVNFTLRAAGRFGGVLIQGQCAGGPPPTPTPVPPTPTPTPVPPTPTPTPVPPTPTPTPVPPTPTPTPVPPTPTPVPGVCTPTLTITETRPGGAAQFTSITAGPGTVTVDPINTGGGLQGYSLISATNAVVTIPAFTIGTTGPVTATFTRPNAGQPVDFTLRASAVFSGVFIRAQCGVGARPESAFSLNAPDVSFWLGSTAASLFGPVRFEAMDMKQEEIAQNQ